MCKADGEMNNAKEEHGEASAESQPLAGLPVVFNIGYAVPIKKDDTLQILKGLSGAFLPKKLTALMGPSGSGKSTLLDCLAGRKNSGTIDGNILYGDHVATPSDYRLGVGYVEQFDTLVGELTVEKMLKYTAELKLPTSFTPAERTSRVNEVIAMLDLESCRQTVIGNSLSRGISGGQAKRVNIGLALITRPPVLFLDEPTSGLDSRTADEVVALLRRLAHEGGRTIVCTIHSPSGHAFAQFDDLYMIVNGETVFDGPLHQVERYFEILGYVRDPASSLPEWLVDLTSGMMPQLEEQEQTTDCEETIGNNPKTLQSSTSGRSSFSETFASSSFKRDRGNERQKVLKRISEMTQPKTADRPPSSFRKLLTMLKYRTIAHYQDGEFLGVRFGEKIVYALLLFSLYWQIGDNLDQQSIQSTSSLLFLIATLCGFGAAAFVPILNLERNLFYRELADGMYTPMVYFLNKFIEEAFIALFTSAIFTAMIYFGCALPGSFGVLFISYYLTALIGIQLAYLFAAAVPSLEAANTLLPLYVTMCLFFGGFFIVFDKIPVYWNWFSWTVFLRFAWGSMMVDSYATSAPGQMEVFQSDTGSPITILEFYGMSDGPIMNSVGACIGILCGLLVLISGFCLAALTYIRHERR